MRIRFGVDPPIIQIHSNLPSIRLEATSRRSTLFTLTQLRAVLNTWCDTCSRDRMHIAQAPLMRVRHAMSPSLFEISYPPISECKIAPTGLGVFSGKDNFDKNSLIIGPGLSSTPPYHLALACLQDSELFSRTSAINSGPSQTYVNEAAFRDFLNMFKKSIASYHEPSAIMSVPPFSPRIGIFNINTFKHTNSLDDRKMGVSRAENVSVL
ncbi:hypothetical protein EDB83DRAFT_2678760 [Lactarius deliciosus]|nr:hypothetical protein EDB83DRAFT_2678760 [Lactarius deliciosus]